MASRMMDVPIDLDDDSSSFSLDISRDFFQSAISTALSLKHSRSVWSSSSGSFYDDDEATTSPIDLGGKWYWNSPVGDSSDSTDSGATSYTHDSGCFSRSNSMELKSGDNSLSGRPKSQVHRRSISNTDPSGPQEVMIKRLQSNREIELLQHLNSSLLRSDPWNPSPPLISIVNADEYDSDEPLAIFEPLVPYNSDPIATVEEALDFFMQLLQGLVFLQENKIVHGDIHSGTIMMDPSSSTSIEGAQRNRVQRGIRYHLIDFTHASMVREQDDHLFLEDLKGLGILMEKTVGNNLPELSDIIHEMTGLQTIPGVNNSLTTASRILGDLEDVVAGLSTERIKNAL